MSDHQTQKANPYNSIIVSIHQKHQNYIFYGDIFQSASFLKSGCRNQKGRVCNKKTKKNKELLSKFSVRKTAEPMPSARDRKKSMNVSSHEGKWFDFRRGYEQVKGHVYEVGSPSDTKPAKMFLLVCVEQMLCFYILEVNADYFGQSVEGRWQQKIKIKLVNLKCHSTIEHFK